MNKVIQSGFAFSCFFLLDIQPVSAATGESITGLSTQVVFIITIVVSLIFGFILTRIAAENRQARRRILVTKAKGQSGELDPNEVLRELQNLSGSAKSQKKAAMAISGLLEEKVEAKVAMAKKELTEKYGQLVEEKSKVAAEAQKKFKRTLTEKKQTEAIVRSVAAGVVVVNNKGEVLLMNPAAEKLLETTKEEKAGRPLNEGAKDEQMISLASTSLDGETDIELNSSEDTKKILRSSSAVIEDENGQTVGMVTVLNDVTKQKELDAMKSQFLSNVTHELRNPIGAIKQSISVILEGTTGELSEPQKKFLSNAKRNLERLSALVDDILDLAKLEAKKMDLTICASHIEEVISEVCVTMDTWAKNKEITLAQDVEEGLPAINIDPDRVTQILINIISNAIKFTPQDGTITIGAKMNPEKDFMMCTVKDTGVGIAKEDLSKIFGKFQQAKNRSAGDKSGTGLGLTIAQELVQLHGGAITVDSKEGQGTTFTFTLSMGLSAPSNEEEETQEESD